MRNILLLLSVSLHYRSVSGQATLSSASGLLYADPLFDGAHDAEFVWSEQEQTWWMTYLQNRYNTPLTDPAGPCAYCSYTDIGLASTPDNGTTWIYRGVAKGLDVPLAMRKDRTNLGTQQFGGATWYRPAVLKVGVVYHGFWVYWEPSTGLLGDSKIVHYTSLNLKDWKYSGIVPGDHGYDSVVFAMAKPDGRYILFSTNSNSPRPHQAFESLDLDHWRPVNSSDQGLNVTIGEGPHVAEWRGARWLNWEGCGLARSDDGGESWVTMPAGQFCSTSKPFAGKREFDIGIMHQGPISVQGNRAFYLYFVEFPLNITYCTERGLQTMSAYDTWGRMAAGCDRSLLQIAEVQYDQAGRYLTVDRDAPFTLEMIPPLDRATTTQTSPTVWHVGKEDAMVIALAEVNRWFPTALYDQGLCEASNVTAEAGQPSCGPHRPATACIVPNCIRNKVVPDFRIADRFYSASSVPSVDKCVAECAKNMSCTAVVFKAANATGLASCGGIGETCCYLMAAPNIEVSNCDDACARQHAWSSWSRIGLETTPKMPPKLANPQRLWRNPDTASRYFRIVTSEGEKSQLVWHLEFEYKDETTKKLLQLSISVHGNGTILNVSSGGKRLHPVMQFYRPMMRPPLQN